MVEDDGVRLDLQSCGVSRNYYNLLTVSVAFFALFAAYMR